MSSGFKIHDRPRVDSAVTRDLDWGDAGDTPSIEYALSRYVASLSVPAVIRGTIVRMRGEDREFPGDHMLTFGINLFSEYATWSDDDHSEPVSACFRAATVQVVPTLSRGSVESLGLVDVFVRGVTKASASSAAWRLFRLFGRVPGFTINASCDSRVGGALTVRSASSVQEPLLVDVSDSRYVFRFQIKTDHSREE